MTQHIKKLYLTLFITIGLFANQTDKNIFTFYKAFANCEDPFSKITVYAYTDEEANNVYSNTKIDLKNYSCKPTKRIFEDSDLFFLENVVDFYDGVDRLEYEHFYSDCAYYNLEFKVNKQEVCISNNENDIFNKVFILNNNYLILNKDSFYFVFNNLGLVNRFQITEQQLANKNKVYDFIRKLKQPLYKEANENSKTNMYLIKNDVVEILEEKENWIYILYITKDKKEIKAWVQRNAFEFKSSNE